MVAAAGIQLLAHALMLAVTLHNWYSVNGFASILQTICFWCSFAVAAVSADRCTQPGHQAQHLKDCRCMLHVLQATMLMLTGSLWQTAPRGHARFAPMVGQHWRLVPLPQHNAMVSAPQD
jgi:hypothetical protein